MRGIFFLISYYMCDRMYELNLIFFKEQPKTGYPKGKGSSETMNKIVKKSP